MIPLDATIAIKTIVLYYILLKTVGNGFAQPVTIKERRKSMKTTLWKIRNKETGKFSKGGLHYGDSIWTKGGKTWSNIGHVKNHLRTYMNGDTLKPHYPYHNAEIVEIEVDYTDLATIDVTNFIDEQVIKQN